MTAAGHHDATGAPRTEEVRRVGRPTGTDSAITLLHQQLDVLRQLDRQLGAVVVHDELNAKIRQVQGLTTHSLAPETREPLAALLSEMHTLAGWQALDLGDAKTSWQQYEQARSAAAQSHSVPHESCAVGGQAFALIDAGATRDAVALLEGARRRADTTAPRLKAFLAAAHGDALALFGHPDAITVLTDALNHLDPTFVRTETSLQVDLATAHATNGDRDEARTHANRATQLATQVGSARLHRRSTILLTALS